MAQPAPQMAPATRNPISMILGVLAAAVIVLGAILLSWLSGGTESFKGTDAPISMFWSTDLTVEVSFLSSAGLIILGIGAIVLIGGLINRNGLLVVGGLLAVIAFALIVITLLRLELVDIGVGDFGIGLWAILVGGVVAIAAGIMGRRATA